MQTTPKACVLALIPGHSHGENLWLQDILRTMLRLSSFTLALQEEVRISLSSNTHMECHRAEYYDPYR